MSCLFKLIFLKRNIKRHKKHNIAVRFSCSWNTVKSTTATGVSHLLNKVKDRSMFCHTTPQWNCKENQISSVSKEKLSHVCVYSGRAVAGKEPRQSWSGFLQLKDFLQAERTRGCREVNLSWCEYRWALRYFPCCLTDGTTSMSLPSRRDSRPGCCKKLTLQMHNNFRCWSPSWVKQPWRTRGTGGSLRWVAVGISLILPCRQVCMSSALPQAERGWGSCLRVTPGDTKV